MVKPLSFLARDSQLRCPKLLKNIFLLNQPVTNQKRGRFCFEIALRAAGHFALTAVGILSNSCIAVAGDIAQL